MPKRATPDPGEHSNRGPYTKRTTERTDREIAAAKFYLSRKHERGVSLTTVANDFSTDTCPLTRSGVHQVTKELQQSNDVATPVEDDPIAPGSAGGPSREAAGAIARAADRARLEQSKNTILGACSAGQEGMEWLTAIQAELQMSGQAHVPASTVVDHLEKIKGLLGGLTGASQSLATLVEQEFTAGEQAILQAASPITRRDAALRVFVGVETSMKQALTRMVQHHPPKPGMILTDAQHLAKLASEEALKQERLQQKEAKAAARAANKAAKEARAAAGGVRGVRGRARGRGRGRPGSQRSTQVLGDITNSLGSASPAEQPPEPLAQQRCRREPSQRAFADDFVVYDSSTDPSDSEFSDLGG